MEFSLPEGTYGIEATYSAVLQLWAATPLLSRKESLCIGEEYYNLGSLCDACWNQMHKIDTRFQIRAGLIWAPQTSVAGIWREWQLALIRNALDGVQKQNGPF